MLRAYRLSKSDSVLLLGEGNFSFCKDFIIFNEKVLQEEFNSINVTATCREDRVGNFNDFKEDNIQFIQSKGVTVHSNVDATSLKFNPLINNQKYDKIIFNFPHVGGKMKIHLNRKLLKDFFSSACDVLNDDGSIVVALCDGQGGTEVDKKQRNWNDSWQITEMAAQSDLILYSVEPFEVKYFSNYINVGYRSCEKSFHCENAIVYSFRRHQPPRILNVDSETWIRPQGDTADVLLSAMEKYLLNPWSNLNSASNFLFQKLTEEIQTSCSIVEHESLIRYNLTVSANTNLSSDFCDINSIMKNIYNSLHFEGSLLHKCIIVKGLMTTIPVFLKEFSNPPFRCQVLIFGHNLIDSLNQCLLGLLNLFELEYDFLVKNNVTYSTINLDILGCDKQYVDNIIESFSLPNGVSCYIVHVDKLAQILFKIKEWRSLWDGHVCTSSGKPIFHPTVISPKEYAFDLGLSVPLHTKYTFENEFFLTLWLLAGDIITNVEHLTTYEPSDRELICYCYRITYKSHNAPLHRKRVIYFHEKIIAKVVSRVLQVNIT